LKAKKSVLFSKRTERILRCSSWSSSLTKKIKIDTQNEKGRVRSSPYKISFFFFFFAMQALTLPTGIESYLKEVGFTLTEMLVVRKLMESNSLSLRELASQTGKSTGVLDQATKKLAQKKIIQKRLVNDFPRYCLISLDAVVHFVSQGTSERKEMLERKHQNFQEFISTIKTDVARPHMEYFDGPVGIAKAYEELLELREEFLTIAPCLCSTEDPLRTIRERCINRRKAYRTKQRVIAPNTALARSLKFRDGCEFRETRLVSGDTCPISFEKTIVGDTIACIDCETMHASFIRYPTLALAEKHTFEFLWNAAQEPKEDVWTEEDSLSE
jgi:sugar-specific transcriptional regulator TrmB